MNRIALIIPYFGTLPNYFSLWLKTAAYNKNFDFLLFTDCNLAEYGVPYNVKCIQMTFDEVKQRVGNILNFKYVLHNPYKLCDYKPLYGLIFSDYLREYEFWGHCDPDIIWGDLSAYITDDILSRYDRLYRRGHLCIYRNVPEINRAAITLPQKGKISYQDVYRHKYIAHYDEGVLIEKLVQQQGGRIWAEDDFADISYFHKQFVLVKHDALCKTVAAFRWKNGKLTSLNVEGAKEQEYSYIHLQKRKMSYVEKLSDDFIITPTGFIPYTDFWKEMAVEWLKPDPAFEKRAQLNNRKNQIKNIKEGALIFRFKNKLWEGGMRP